ncbi:hypothetical protein [Crocosphaera sp. Alani8]|uniref:hypothetical protein n=1 Tax=Crocosphaera sp. Alani8 TaxID=3038952 RepID=UPI00313CDFB8
MQRHNLVDLQQRLNNYSIASRVIPLPVPQYFYPESIGNGHLVLPKDWLRLSADNELYVKMRTQDELTDLSIVNGLGLEIDIYKYLMIVMRHAGEKWTEFILDPIRRLSLRKDVQALADFVGTNQVIYLPGSGLPELETYTLSQLVSELEHQKYQEISVKSIVKQVQSYQQVYQELPEFYCIDKFDHLITSTQLQSLANLQLAILILGLDPDEVDYYRNKLLVRKDLIEQLEISVACYSQSVINVTSHMFDELTQEQGSLINLLSEEFEKYLNCQPFSLLNYWKEFSLQELAEKALKAFAWDCLDISDWIDEQLEKNNDNT